MKTALSLAATIGAVAITYGCSGAEPTKPPVAPTTNSSSTAPAKPVAAADDVPADVRSALVGADTITVDHKDLSAAQIKDIEVDSGTKIADTDHHAYLGFSTAGGLRKQVGAATIVEAGEIKLVLVYESRNGLPYITSVSGGGLPAPFLAQFKGLGHDSPIQIGKDVKPLGVPDSEAKAAADAIRQDTRTMQTLYGSAHSH